MFNLATVKEFLEDTDILLGPDGPQYGLLASIFLAFIIFNVFVGGLNEVGRDLSEMLKAKLGEKSNGSNME